MPARSIDTDVAKRGQNRRRAHQVAGAAVAGGQAGKVVLEGLAMAVRDARG